MSDIIPYGRQTVEDDDIEAVVRTMKSDFLTTGPSVADFEGALAGIVGSDHAVAVANGTAALHLAMTALNIGPGDQVIVPSITFVASANAAALVGAEVIFADCDPDTGLMRPQDLHDALDHAPNAKAVVVVHLNGISADMPALRSIADSHGLRIIEDSCHALGTQQPPDAHAAKDVMVGGCHYADVATFSFHPVKAIATGEGGAVTTNDAELADRIRLLRSHGLKRGEGHVSFDDGLDEDGKPYPWIYMMSEPGWNYRLSDIQAALGVNQLKKLDRFLERRRGLVANYDRLLRPLGDALLPVSRAAREGTITIGWHLYPVLCRGGNRERLALFQALAAADIRAQVHYFPVHRQPYYRSQPTFRALPGADHYYDRVLSLPLYPGLTDSQQMKVVDVITTFYQDMII